MNCPCCGQPIPEHRLLMDLNTNILVYGDREIEIRPPQVAEVMHVLVEKWPMTVSNNDLSYALWGMHEPERVLDNIQVHISRARKLIAGTGMKIETIGGRGYRLIFPISHLPSDMQEGLSFDIKRISAV